MRLRLSLSPDASAGSHKSPLPSLPAPRTQASPPQPSPAATEPDAESPPLQPPAAAVQSEHARVLPVSLPSQPAPSAATVQPAGPLSQLPSAARPADKPKRKSPLGRPALLPQKRPGSEAQGSTLAGSKLAKLEAHSSPRQTARVADGSSRAAKPVSAPAAPENIRLSAQPAHAAEQRTHQAASLRPRQTQSARAQLPSAVTHSATQQAGSQGELPVPRILPRKAVSAAVQLSVQPAKVKAKKHALVDHDTKLQASLLDLQLQRLQQAAQMQPGQPPLASGTLAASTASSLSRSPAPGSTLLQRPSSKGPPAAQSAAFAPASTVSDADRRQPSAGLKAAAEPRTEAAANDPAAAGPKAQPAKDAGTVSSQPVKQLPHPARAAESQMQVAKPLPSSTVSQHRSQPVQTEPQREQRRSASQEDAAEPGTPDVVLFTPQEALPDADMAAPSRQPALKAAAGPVLVKVEPGTAASPEQAAPASMPVQPREPPSASTSQPGRTMNLLDAVMLAVFPEVRPGVLLYATWR